MPGAELIHQAADGAGAAGNDVNIHDGVGNPLTSTVVGADQALDVNIVAGAGSGGTSMVDDAVFAPGVTAVTPAGAMFDDVAPDSVDEGDGGVVRMSANRNLYVTLRDALGNERGLAIAADNTLGVNDAGGDISVDDGGGSLTVDSGGVDLDTNLASVAGAATASNAGNADAGTQRVVLATDQVSVSVDLSAAIPAGGNNIGDVDVLTVPAPLNVVGGGTEAAALRVTLANDSTGLISIDDNAGSLTVDNPILSVVGGGTEAAAQRVTIANDSTGVVTVDDGGGALTIDGTVTAANTAGDTADDAADGGNPVKIGGVAVETDGTDPTSVSAEGDRAEVRTDLNRRLLVNTGHPNAWVSNNNYGAAQTNQQQKAAPGANLSLYIQKLIISADAAVNVLVVDDTAGAPATILGPYYIGANAGADIEFKPPIRVAANTDIGITSSAAVNHTATITGFTAP